MPDYLQRKIAEGDPRVASIFDELSFWSSRFGHFLFENLEFRRDVTVLDLACGSGFPLFEMAHSFGTSCRLAGVDLWAPALERASLKFQVYELPNVIIVRADGSRLPFRPGQFDLITSNLGINNFENPGAVFRECYRVTGPGGTIVITSNIKGHMQEFYDLYRRTLKDLGLDHCLDRLDVQESHRGTKESVCRLLEDCGYRMRRVVEDSFVMRYMDGSALFRHFLTRIGFLDGWRNILDPGDDNTVFGELEQRLNEEALRKGEVRMTVPMLLVEGVK